MDVSSLQPLVAPLSFFLLFVVLWLGITGGLAHVSGWADMATKFRQRKPFLGESFTSVSGAMGKGRFPVGYRSCLSVVVGQTGFSLAVLFPFRLLSPPLLIPWSQVETVVDEKLLFARYTRVRLHGQWQVISIRGPAGQRIKEGYERVLRQPALSQETPLK